MDPTSPNFFALLLLGAALCFGLAPAFAPALVFVGLLWIIAAAPHLGVVIVIALAVAVILKAPIRWPLESVRKVR